MFLYTYTFPFCHAWTWAIQSHQIPRQVDSFLNHVHASWYSGPRRRVWTVLRWLWKACLLISCPPLLAGSEFSWFYGSLVLLMVLALLFSSPSRSSFFHYRRHRPYLSLPPSIVLLCSSRIPSTMLKNTFLVLFSQVSKYTPRCLFWTIP